MFVALMLGAEQAEPMRADVEGCLVGDAREEPPLRLVEADDLHLTLFFLGPVEGARRAGLEQALAGALDASLAPELELGPSGAFPSAARPSVLWIGVRERGIERLDELQAGVARACRGQGFRRDPRAWTPHVTVARMRHGRGRRDWAPPTGFFELDPELAWKPSAVTLVQSLPPGGPRAYLPLREFPFFC
jgi:2'-5' RNA ligase